MTNIELIQREIIKNKLEGEANDYKSFALWKTLGFKVKKGEKSKLKVGLIHNKKVKDEAGNITQTFSRRGTILFHKTQVEPIKSKEEK